MPVSRSAVTYTQAVALCVNMFHVVDGRLMTERAANEVEDLGYYS